MEKMPKKRKCCVPRCDSTNRTHRLFNFPRNDEVRKLWISFLTPAGVQLRGLSKKQMLSMRVCQKHFDKHQFTVLGSRLLRGYPCLFTEKEIDHGTPLLLSSFNHMEDHKYSLQSLDNKSPEAVENYGLNYEDDHNYYLHNFEMQLSANNSTTALVESQGNMTKGLETSSFSGKVLNFHHLVFWVGNAKTASSYFVTRFGFKPLAVREPTDDKPVISYAVSSNKITIIFESPTKPEDEITDSITSHGDFVKDVAFEVHNLKELVRRAKEGGAEIVKHITEDEDKDGIVRYAVLKTYGDNTHTLIDRSQYKGILLPGFKPVEDDPLNGFLPDTKLTYIDHVEGNMADGTLEDSVAWYEKNLNMHRFWCVDYSHDLVPFSCINSASVINQDETVLLSMNEAAKGLRPTSKATDFVKSLGTSGVEHVALYTDDIVDTMRSLIKRGADIVTWPPTYYDIIREKLKNSSVKVAESIDVLQENHILIDFDERGYMLQAFTKHVQSRPTVFIEILQRRNHRGFGAMNYQWVFEAIQRLEATKESEKDENKSTN